MLAWFSEDGGTLFPRGTIAFFLHSAKITNICMNVPVRRKKTVDSFPYWLVGKPEVMRKFFLLLQNISTKFHILERARTTQPEFNAQTIWPPLLPFKPENRRLSLIEVVFVSAADLRQERTDKNEADILFVHCCCFPAWSCCRPWYV